MADFQLPEVRTGLLSHIRDLAVSSSSLESLQTAIVAAMAQRLPHFSWTGFYMLDSADPSPAHSKTLVLGPFVGAPTPHVRIPVTQGICGAAVASGETVIVDDVAADPRYLSCSIDTRSEIVVPIYVHASVIGEIDIDSHAPAAFTEADRTFLEEVARIVGQYIERYSEKSPAHA